MGRHPTAEPRQQRKLDKAYCLVDEEGNCKPFSSVSELSGRNYEGVVSKIFASGGPRTLRAVYPQDMEERQRLETSKEAIANFLQETVSDSAGDGMRRMGVRDEQAEVDTVYDGSFKDFAESIRELSTVKVSATCAKVQRVLVEICSDSRFVAMKLYQIEIQSCLVDRSGFLTIDGAREPVQLDPQTTGFAIVFNRAALQVDTEELAQRLDLNNVIGLLKNKKLHIVYFQSEAAVPAALSIARKAEEKAEAAEQKLNTALQQLQGTTLAMTKAVWVRQLQKDGRDVKPVDNKDKFPVQPVPANVGLLKDVIKDKNPNTVKCDAYEMKIYILQDDKWEPLEPTSELHDGADYGFVLPTVVAE